MSFTIGYDAEVIIDSTGFFVKPKSYKMHQPRVRKATTRADGGQAYVDLGPGKRVWSMTILCLNDQQKYDGTPTGLRGSSTATPCGPATSTRSVQPSSIAIRSTVQRLLCISTAIAS